jgi:hypothetical protein
MDTRGEAKIGFLRELILVGALAVVVSAIPAQAQPCPRDRAMWIYQTPYDVVRDLDARAEALAFADTHAIGDFFLYVSFNCIGDNCSLDESYQVELRSFLREAHDSSNHQAFRVHVLYDDPRLALETFHNRVRSIVRTTLAFNQGSGAGEQFDGIHLDVEPHTLVHPPHDEYLTDPIGTITQFLNMNTIVLEELQGRDLDYGADVVDFWHPYYSCRDWEDPRCFVDRLELRMVYNNTENYPTMHLLNLVKNVTIMSYHDADQMIRKTRYAMNYAAMPEIGALVYVGVKAELFASRAQLEDAICAVDGELAQFASLAGYSYFKYSTYHDLSD